MICLLGKKEDGCFDFASRTMPTLTCHAPRYPRATPALANAPRTTRYEISSDPTETSDVSADYPEKYRELYAAFVGAVASAAAAEYACGCMCEASCDSLYEVFVNNSVCFVSTRSNARREILSSVVCRLSSVICRLSFVVCRLPSVVCRLSSAFVYLLPSFSLP